MKFKILISAILFYASFIGFAQVSRPLPVLQGNPDARSVSLGGVIGAKTDRMYLYTSPGAILFQENKLRVDISTEIFPKVQGLKGRTMQYALTGGYRFHERHAGFIGFRYQGGLELPYIDASQENKEILVRPFDWVVDAGYAYKINECFALNASANLIASWLGKGAYTGSFSIGGYFQNSVNMGNTPAIASVGLRVADIGAPLTYREKGMSYAIPSSIQLGGGLDMELAPAHQLNLLVGTRYFFLPKDAALFTMGIGTEYAYNDMLFARAGFEYGQRSQSFGTFGVGGKYKGFSLDAAYRMATAKDFGVNTLQLSLGYSF